MTTLIPAIRGKLGNTEFYETTMKVQDLLQGVIPPSELDEWANFSIEERMQRNPDEKRIRTQLAPYLARKEDRFFGSIIVLVYKGEIAFEPMSDLTKGLPAAYKANANRLGFITIDGGKRIILDGQHRWRGLRMVRDGEVAGPYASQIVDDEVCVIFVQHQDSTKTRRIFNTVNRYAKQTSRGDNIITSEDDGYAIVSRWLLREDAPLGVRIEVGGKVKDIVNWEGNTLSKRSVQLTTISAVYETVKLILRAHGVEKLPEQERPAEEDLETYLTYCSEVWDALLQGIPAYQEAIADPSKIPAMREDGASTALLFKPAAQIALVDGLLRAVDMGGLKIGEAIDRVARFANWSMDAELWNGIIIKRSGAIDAGPEARRRMAGLLCYLIAADRLSDEAKFAVWSGYNAARVPEEFDAWRKSGGTNGKVEDLPEPVEGTTFTAEEAKVYAAKSGDLKAA